MPCVGLHLPRHTSPQPHFEIQGGGRHRRSRRGNREDPEIFKLGEQPYFLTSLRRNHGSLGTRCTAVDRRHRLENRGSNRRTQVYRVLATIDRDGSPTRKCYLCAGNITDDLEPRWNILSLRGTAPLKTCLTIDNICPCPYTYHLVSTYVVRRRRWSGRRFLAHCF